MLPKDYPFIYRSSDEAYMWLARIQENYEWARQLIEPYRKYIVEKYERDLTVRGKVDYVRSAVNQYLNYNVEHCPNKAVRNVVEETLLEFDEDFTFSSFLQVLNKRMFQPVKFARPDQIQNRQATPLDIRMILIGLGYEDRCDGPEPVFHKLKESVV
jgi:hypothetical protein